VSNIRLFCPDSPSDLGFNSNKFPEWREQQDDAIERISVAFCGKKFFLLDSPTGSGKSLVALSTSKLNPGKTVILTFTKQLQRQYKEDFPYIKEVRGRGNFTCALNPQFKVDEAPCAIGFTRCNAMGQCDYHIQKAEAVSALNAGIPVVTNYSYFLREANSGKQLSNLNLLICDEGRLAEGALQRYIQIRIRRRDLERCKIRQPSWTTIRQAIQWARDKYPEVLSAYESAREYMKSATDPFSSDILISQTNSLKNLCRELHKLGNIDPTWIMYSFKGSWMFKPVWVRKLTAPLFSHAQHILLQSALLLPKYTANLLGIPEDEFEEQTLPCLFPVDRRPFYYWPIARITYKAKDTEYQKLSFAIDQIISEHPGDKAIIHTVNYALAKRVIDGSKYKDLFITHDAFSREEAIERFLNTEHTILVSPSVLHGLDARFERATYQIFAKCPWADQGDKQVSARLESDSDWYALNCISNIVQGTGRVVRDKTDFGETWFLDKTLDMLFEHWEYFPSWFTDAMHKVERPLNMQP
jgi:Rad3-related DNA helicase